MKRLIVALLLALILPVSSVSAASVNDFTISNYDIQYTLGRDSEQRSTLKTVETITAEFSQSDQNHGIERAIPQTYDNHPTHLKVESVKKLDGSKWEYSTYFSNGNLVLRIGDADTYVHGTQSYVISYSQRDVTRYFADTKDDEFYWDTNGTDWQVPIEQLSVTLQLDASLEDSLNGNTSCYLGVIGSTGQCQLMHSEKTFTTSANNLGPGENITLAIGFHAGTFAAYTQSTWEKLFDIGKYIWFGLWVVGFALIFWVGSKWSSVVSRKKEIGTIVPEYLPPSDASVTVSASILDYPRSVFAAQLLDFAVRHYVKIYEIEKSNLLGIKGKDYAIEIIRDVHALRSEEREILEDIFGGPVSVGQRLPLSELKNNSKVYTATLDNDKKLKELVRGEYGLRTKDAKWVSWFRRVALGILLFAVVTLSPMLGFAALVAFISSFTVWVLTDKGLALSRYLEGLRMYIEVAETERIKMLQSPEGAAKVSGTDPNDKAQLVKLYERTLPYAVLFGLEKEWNKQIGTLYETLGGQPDWYSGHGVFNALVFSSAMNSFNTSAGYSAPASSGSGGSGGGGSSGGGGGGGGGGGW